MRRIKGFLAIALVLFCVAGCKRERPQNNVTDLPDSGAVASAAEDVVFGDVVETMDASQYTYVQIDTGDEKMWAAAPASEVKVGDRIGFSPTNPMVGWHSTVLDREFDVVYFVGAFEHPDGTPVATRGHGMSGASAGGHTSGPTDVKIGTIEKAEGGRTVAEIHAQKDELEGQTVTFRGKVTKYNAQILGKNWLHVQDGSGDASAQTHDLTVTTDAQVGVGDTVLVSGVLARDKDFGYGYKYDVIVQDAEVVVQ